MMKKLFSLLLAAMMVLGAVSALADMPKDAVPDYDDDGNLLGYYKSETDKKTGVVTTYWYDENGNLTQKQKDTSTQSDWEAYDQAGNSAGHGTYQYDDSSKAWQSVTYTGSGIKDTESRGSWADNSWETVKYNWDGSVKYIRMSKENEDGGMEYDVYLTEKGDLYRTEDSYIGGLFYDSDYGCWRDDSGNVIDDPNLGRFKGDLKAFLESLKKKKVVIPEPIWYGNNTAGVIGISLRDTYPTLTKKWYHVVPVDLSQDGTQTLPIVASNMYYMGNVTVTVAGDSVTTTYAYPKNPTFEIYPKDECLAWFTGVEEITSEFLENPASDMKFGTAISKEKDLNGQECALLFMCNHLTYRVPFNSKGASPTRFWPNHPKMASYFATAKTLMEAVENEYAEKKAAAESTGAETAETVTTETETALKEAAETAKTEAETALTEAAETVKTEAETALTEAAETVKETLDTVKTDAEEALTEAAETAKEALEIVKTDAETALTEAAETVKTEAEEALTEAADTAKETLETVKTDAEETVRETEETLKTGTETQKNALESTADNLKDMLKNITQKKPQ